jgi:hypothetical protein
MEMAAEMEMEMEMGRRRVSEGISSETRGSRDVECQQLALPIAV